MQSGHSLPLLRLRLPYRSRGTAGIDAEQKIGEAVVAEGWLARCVLQGEGTWDKAAHRFHFHSQGSHRSVGVALWKRRRVNGTENIWADAVDRVLVVVRGKLQAR